MTVTSSRLRKKVKPCNPSPWRFFIACLGTPVLSPRTTPLPPSHLTTPLARMSRSAQNWLVDVEVGPGAVAAVEHEVRGVWWLKAMAVEDVVISVS